MVKVNGLALLGRDWISQLKVRWARVHRVTAVETVESLCEKYSSVFQPQLAMLKGITAKIHVTNGAVPKFCKPRPVPYALKEAVEKQLVKLVSEGVLTPANYSEWAAPIVCS